MTRPVEVRCLLSTIGFRHSSHDSRLSNTVFHCDGWPVIKYPKVKVAWKEAPRGIFKPVMWVGECTGCDYTTQYWAWGATMGRMLEHQWKGCNNERS